MWTKSEKQSEAEFAREFNRGVFRSTFVSVFWAVIQAKKAAGAFTFKELAYKLGRDKSVVSRWFSGEPNWEIVTVADIAEALNVDIKIMAVDRETGQRFAPFGEVVQTVDTRSPPSQTKVLDNRKILTRSDNPRIVLHAAA